jgi:hypothetical protein
MLKTSIRPSWRSAISCNVASKPGPARRNAEFNALVAKHGIDKVLEDAQRMSQSVARERRRASPFPHERVEFLGWRRTRIYPTLYQRARSNNHPRCSGQRRPRQSNAFNSRLQFATTTVRGCGDFVIRLLTCGRGSLTRNLSLELTYNPQIAPQPR